MALVRRGRRGAVGKLATLEDASSGTVACGGMKSENRGRIDVERRRTRRQAGSLVDSG
jgi:hypothetical protein